MELTYIVYPNGMQSMVFEDRIITIDQFSEYIAKTRGSELREESLMELQELVWQNPADYDLLPVKGLRSGKDLGFIDGIEANYLKYKKQRRQHV